MSDTIDWQNLPYDHSGRWTKKYPSIMNPDEKVTWPQLIAEYVIFWRKRLIKGYPDVPAGKGWSSLIQKQVRDLNQQSTVICNYFPHPDDEPLVIYAVKKYFREQKPLKIGQYRKNRVSKKGNSVTITQAEKDVVLGINHELTKVIKTRECYKSDKPLEEVKENQKFSTKTSYKSRRGSLSKLLEMESQLKKIECESDKE